MQDPEFEKQVRKKMEELKFSPSESVWFQVEKQIQADRRRRAPLLWIFFFGSLVLLGGLLFLLNSRSISGNRYAVGSDRKLESTDQKPSKLSLIGSDSIRNNSPVPTEISLQSSPSSKSEAAARKGVKSLGSVPDKNKIRKNLHADSDLPQNDLANSGKTPDAIAENEIQYEKKPGKSKEQIGMPIPLTPGTTQALPKDKSLPEDSGKKSSADSIKSVARNSSATVLRSKHPWIIGFNFIPGISGLSAYSMEHPNNNAPAYSPSGMYPPSSSLPGSYSDSKPGFSLSAGIWVQKNLSQNVYLSFGLNYHYYSRISSLIMTDTINSSPTDKLSHTDQFHFLQLPIGLGFRFSRNSNFPLFGEVGFSLSQMLNTNAGQFTNTSGAYSSNRDLFRHFQVDLTAAILYAMPSRSHSIFIGPAIQYGPQNMFANGVNQTQHLWFAGLRFNYSLKK